MFFSVNILIIISKQCFSNIGRSCNQDLFWQQQGFFSFTVSDRLWGPPTLQANRYWRFFHKGKSCWDMKLITHFCLVLRYKCIELYLHSLVCFVVWCLLKYKHRVTLLCFTVASLPTQLCHTFYICCLYFWCDDVRMLAEVRR